MPKGGFLLSIISIRWGSVFSNSSIVLTPALTSFLTVTIPSCSICLSCSGLSSQARAPRLRSSIRALRIATESSRNSWQSITQRIRRFICLKMIEISMAYCCLCFIVLSFQGISAPPRIDWTMSEVLWMGRARSTGIGNLIDGDLLSSLYIDFSPARNRTSLNSAAWASAESYLIQSAKSRHEVMHNNWEIQ